MATYRPKKLDEINEVYGKSLEAQKTIRQSSDMLGVEPADVSVKVSADTDASDTSFLADDIPFDADISDIANDFILRFGTPERAAATTRLQEDEAQRAIARASSQSIKAKVKPVAADTARPAIHQSSADAESPAESKKSDDSAKSIATTPPIVRKVSSEKTELMEDYMRVMSDEDDEGPLFRRRKKDKKRKAKKTHQEIIPDDSGEVDSSADTALTAEDTGTALSVDTPADEPVVLTDEDSADIAAADTDESNDTDESKDVADTADSADVSDSEAEIAAEDIASDTDADTQSTDGDNSSEEEAPLQHSSREKKKTAKSHTAAKVLLSLLLAVLVVLAGAVGAVKLILAPDTGTLVADKYYLFTSDADHSFVDVSKGDLVITEKVLPQINDSFVYADKNTQSFVFAKLYSSILDLDGDVLYIAESDDSRATVMRDDAKGIFYKIVPGVGTALSIVGEYYIIIISALLILCLVIILILSFAFKKKSYDEIEGDDDIEIDTDEYEDIFSTSTGEKVDLFSEIE